MLHNDVQGNLIRPVYCTLQVHVLGFLELCNTPDTGRSVPSQAFFCSYGRSSLVTFADTDHSPQQWYLWALLSNQSSKQSTLRQPLRRPVSGSAALPATALLSSLSNSSVPLRPSTQGVIYTPALVHTSWHLLPAIVILSSLVFPRIVVLLPWREIR